MEENGDVGPSSTPASVEPSPSVRGEKELYYLLYHKPRGVECTTNQRIACSWVNLIDSAPPIPSSSSLLPFPSHAKHQLISVGRLDKDSEGLLLLTNDSSIVNPLMNGATAHYEKEYEVEVNRPFDATPDSAFLTRLRRGEAIRRGTVPILPPVAVEPLLAAGRRPLLDADDSASSSLLSSSAALRAKQLKKEQKRARKLQRRKQEQGPAASGTDVAASMGGEEKEEDEVVNQNEDEDEDDDNDDEANKRKRGASNGGHEQLKKRRTTNGGKADSGDDVVRQRLPAAAASEVEDSQTTTSLWFKIVLREGKNRQIRRMVRVCSDNDLIVRRLVRVRLGGLNLTGLTSPGSWRHLNPDEVADLKRHATSTTTTT